MSRCEVEKMRYRSPLLEEPCAQTLSGIKGPENPTCQLLPISSKKKGEDGMERQERERRWWKTNRVKEFCVRRLCVRYLKKHVQVAWRWQKTDRVKVVWERVVCVCEKVVCERVVCEKVYVSSVEMVEERLCERAMSAKTVAPRQSPAQNGSGCFQMPRLREPSAPPEPAQCPKGHDCHAKRR